MENLTYVRTTEMTNIINSLKRAGIEVDIDTTMWYNNGHHYYATMIYGLDEDFMFLFHPLTGEHITNIAQGCEYD